MLSMLGLDEEAVVDVRIRSFTGSPVFVPRLGSNTSSLAMSGSAIAPKLLDRILSSLLMDKSQLLGNTSEGEIRMHFHVSLLKDANLGQELWIRLHSSLQNLARHHGVVKARPLGPATSVERIYFLWG